MLKRIPDYPDIDFYGARSVAASSLGDDITSDRGHAGVDEQDQPTHSDAIE
jgi:hypothetical protein